MSLVAAPETRASRADSRRAELLDEAAWLFRQKGYNATSMRDIAGAVGMLPGSLYCHFVNKEELLLAVYEVGIGEISRAVIAAIEDETDPWRRFEAACCAHLEALLKSSDYPRVVVRVLPGDVPSASAQLAALRDGYEAIFAGVIADLPLADDADRAHLRHIAIGALNSTTTWFHPRGDSPRAVARKFARMLRHGLDQKNSG